MTDQPTSGGTPASELPADLTAVLYQIGSAGSPITTADLAACLGMTRSAASKALAALEETGHITRAPASGTGPGRRAVRWTTPTASDSGADPTPDTTDLSGPDTDGPAANTDAPEAC